MITLPFVKQRYERWRIPVLFFALLALSGLVMDITHNDYSTLRTIFYTVAWLPVLMPRNLTYVVIGSILLAISGLLFLWGLMLLFAWSNATVHISHPGIFFFVGFSLVVASVSAAAMMVYLGLNESIPAKTSSRA